MTRTPFKALFTNPRLPFLLIGVTLLNLSGCQKVPLAGEEDGGTSPPADDTTSPTGGTSDDPYSRSTASSSPGETETVDDPNETATRETSVDTHGPGSTDTYSQPIPSDSDTDDLPDTETEEDTDRDNGTGAEIDPFPEGECRPAAPEDEPLKVYFDVRRSSGEFYRLPFPTDLRRGERGIDMTGHFSPPVIGGDDDPADLYIEMMAEDLDGFGTQSAVFFRFNHLPEESTLAADRLGPEQSIFLINLDIDSPAYGEHAGYEARAGAEGNSYICDNWLGVYPADGLPLLPGTPYAVLLTTAITDEDGAAALPDDDLPEMLATAPPTDGTLASAWTAYAPLRRFLADPDALDILNAGLSVPVSRESIAGATVFTTGYPTRRLPGIREAVRSEPAPEADRLMVDETRDDYDLYTGMVRTPFYQAGTRPFVAPEQGGVIQYDESGRPVRVEMEAVNFALTVPTGEAPSAGWPVVIYAHGTGGSERTILGNELAERMAAIGVATLSMEQVQHGDRRAPLGEEVDENTPGPDMLFYNYLNPRATRDNNHQAAAEVFQSVYMVETIDNQTGIAVGLDPDRILFFGHSQGSQGSFLGAVFEPGISGIVLSGAGGLLIESLLNRREPMDIPALLAMLLGDSRIDRLHPLLNIVQATMESVDPVNFAPYVFRTPEPALGLPARSVLMGAGLGDKEVPDVNQRALAQALSLHQWAEAGVPLWDIADIAALDEVPYQGTDGITAVVARYAPSEGYDAHFVMFDNENAIHQTDELIRTLFDPDIDPPVFDGGPDGQGP